MIKNLLSIFSIGLMTVSYGQVQNYTVGQTVNDFTVTDTDGNSHTLYDITATGKYVFLDFFFDTCPPCQATAPTFNELYDKYGCNTGDIYCMSINNGTDNDAEVEAFENTYGGTFHHAPAVSTDGGAGAVNTDFNPAAYPTYILIGPDNKLVSADIWPITDVSTFEAALPITPTPMACTFASIGDTEAMSNLSVYPNPTNIELNITFDAAISTMATIEITNLLGQVIMTENIQTTVGQNQRTLNVEGLAEGQYIAKVVMNDQISTFKFTKQ